MKYCNLNCKHIDKNIIVRGCDVISEYRCMAQRHIPKVTTDTYCPYDEINENNVEESNVGCALQVSRDTKIEYLEEELAVYKKALNMACEELEEHPYSQWNTNEWFNYFSQKAREL